MIALMIYTVDPEEYKNILPDDNFIVCSQLNEVRSKVSESFMEDLLVLAERDFQPVGQEPFIDLEPFDFLIVCSDPP